MAEEEPAEEPVEKTSSVVLYKKEPKTRKNYGITKVMIMPGLSADYSDGYDEPIKYTPYIPALSEDCGEDYTPMTYTFRVPQLDTSKKIKNLRTKSPPFYVLLDHTLAVIWMLVGSGGGSSPLGISQVQWAYSFLRTIKKRNGSYSDDIRLLLDSMQELLRKAYAKLDAEFEKINKANENIKTYDVFGTREDVDSNTISVTYDEMKERGDEVIQRNRDQKEEPLPEDELKQKIDTLIEEMEEFENFDQEKREELIKDFVKYKDQIQKRCEEQMETLLAIQVVMKEVSPELFDEDDLPIMKCTDTPEKKEGTSEPEPEEATE